VIDGPFAETKELVAGFGLWKCASLQEAIEWVKRCPNPMRLRRPERRHFAVIGSSCSEDLAPAAVFHQITGALKKIEAAAACSAAREM